MKGYLLLKNGKIMTSAKECPWIEKGDILIQDGYINQIGPSGSLQLPAAGEYQEKECEGFLLMPGLVNAHSHSQSALTKMTGSADRTNTITALWYGYAHNEGRTIDDINLSAKVNAIQMLKSGCTCTIDQFYFGGLPQPQDIDAVVEGYLSSGMRACVVFDMADRLQKNIMPNVGQELPALAKQLMEKRASLSVTEIKKQYGEAAQKHQRAGEGRIRLFPGTPVPNICSDELLTAIAQMAKEQGVHYTCHMLEHMKERKTTEALWCTPEIEHLTKLGFLGAGLNIAHCIWVTDDEIVAIKKSGASVTHCPELNVKLGGGVAKVRKMLNVGVNVALGADSATNQVIFDVMKLTALIHRVGKPNPQDWIYADEILQMATMGGAKALGLEAEIGSLEVGKCADIVMMDLLSPWLCPETDLACRLVYTETGGSVHTVLVNGDVVLEAGKLSRLKERQVMAQAQEAFLRLKGANQEHYLLADQMSSLLEEEILSLVRTVNVDGL